MASSVPMAEITRKTPSKFIALRTGRKPLIVSRFCPARSEVKEKKATVAERISGTTQ